MLLLIADIVISVAGWKNNSNLFKWNHTSNFRTIAMMNSFCARINNRTAVSGSALRAFVVVIDVREWRQWADAFHRFIYYLATHSLERDLRLHSGYDDDFLCWWVTVMLLTVHNRIAHCYHVMKQASESTRSRVCKYSDICGMRDSFWLFVDSNL